MERILAKVWSWIKRRLVAFIVWTCTDPVVLTEESEAKERMPDCSGGLSVSFSPNPDLPGLLDIQFSLQAVVNPSAIAVILTQVEEDWSTKDHQLTEFFRVIMNKSSPVERMRIKRNMEETAIAVVQLNK